jgi:hypothetical protein
MYNAIHMPFRMFFSMTEMPVGKKRAAGGQIETVRDRIKIFSTL